VAPSPEAAAAGVSDAHQVVVEAEVFEEDIELRDT